MYVWSVRLVATSNEALLLTVLIQKLATTMEKLRWKNLVEKEKLCRNFDGADAQHPFDQTPLRRQLLLKLRRWCLLYLTRSALRLCFHVADIPILSIQTSGTDSKKIIVVKYSMYRK